jgi:hypothetical protein
LRLAFHMEQLSDILNMSHLDHPLPPANRKCSNPSLQERDI